METCTHPMRKLRAAIGPDSGVLCELCGQDVPAVTVMQRAVEEACSMRAEYENAIDSLAMLTGNSRCTCCRKLFDARNVFNGVRQQSLCRPCLELWFDNEDGELSDMHEGYLASYLYQTSHTHKSSRLWDMAHQAFPGIGERIRSLAR